MTYIYIYIYIYIYQGDPEPNRTQLNSTMRNGIGRTALNWKPNRTEPEVQLMRTDSNRTAPNFKPNRTGKDRTDPGRGTEPNRTGAYQEPDRTETRPEPRRDRTGTQVEPNRTEPDRCFCQTPPKDHATKFSRSSSIPSPPRRAEFSEVRRSRPPQLISTGMGEVSTGVGG